MGKNSSEFSIQFIENVNAVKYSRNGKFIGCLTSKGSNKILSAGLKYSLTIYDIENSCERAKISLEGKPIDYICFHNENTNYVVVIFEKSVFLWDIDAQKDCGSIHIANDFDCVIGNFALSDDGKYLGLVVLGRARIANAHFTRIFDIKAGTKVYENKHKPKNVPQNICFSPDNRYAVVIIDGSIFQVLYQTKENMFIIGQMLRVSISGANSINFHPNNKKLYIAEHTSFRMINKKLTSRKGDIVIYDFINKRLDKFLQPYDNDQGAYNFEFNISGSLFLTKSNLGFKVFNNGTGSLVLDISKEIADLEDENKVMSASLDPFKDDIVVSLSDNTVKIIPIYSQDQDELFEIDQVKPGGYTAFINPGSEKYKKPMGCFGKGIISVFVIIGSLFAYGFASYQFGDLGFILVFILTIAIIIYMVYRQIITFKKTGPF